MLPSHIARQTPLVIGRCRDPDGLGFLLTSAPAQRLVGYRAKPHTGVIDLDKIGAL